MADTYTVEAASDQQPAVSGAGNSDVLAVRGEFDLAVDGIGALVISDVIRMVKLPAGHKVVDVIVDSDDLDTNGTPLIAIDVGVVGGDVDAFIQDSQIARAGGIARMDEVTGSRLAVSTSETYLGLFVAAAPATGAATGKIGMTVLYTPA